MRTEKPHAVRCVCKKYPLNAPGLKVRCMTKRCIFEGRKFKDVAEWNQAQSRGLAQMVEVCREFGLIKQCG